MNIQGFIKTIQVPLILELVNNIIHSIFRDASVVGFRSLDIITILATIVILFYLGWQVAAAYSERRLLKAAGFGLFLWFISTIVFTGGIEFLHSSVATKPDISVLTNALIAFVLFIPVAAMVPIVGVLIKTRFSKNGDCETVRDGSRCSATIRQILMCAPLRTSDLLPEAITVAASIVYPVDGDDHGKDASPIQRRNFEVEFLANGVKFAAAERPPYQAGYTPPRAGHCQSAPHSFQFSA